MIEWKRLYAKPAGSLPGGVVTQWGVGAITVFILLFLTYWIWLGGGEPAEVALTEVATTPPRSFTQQMTARVDAETMRAETNKAAEARALRAEQQRQANIAGLTAANQAAVLAGPSPDTGQPYTQEEWELRERLRLEAVERRSRSLRSSPVAQSYRKLDGGGSDGKRIVDNPAPAKDKGAEALQQALDTMHTVTSGLEDQIAAEAQADQAFIAALRGTPTTPEAAPTVPAATAASATAQDYSVPARLEVPQDPPGWERIHRRLVFGSGASNATYRRLPRPGAGRGCHSLLLGGSPTHPCPARNAGYRYGSGRDKPGSIAARGWFSPLDLPGRKLDFAPISRPQSTWRGSLERSNQPPLLFDVRRCWSSRRPQWPHGGGGESLRGRHGVHALRSRARTRPSRYAHSGPFLESLTHHHYSRRTPAPRLVYIRRVGSPAHKRRMKNETNLDRSSCRPTLYRGEHHARSRRFRIDPSSHPAGLDDWKSDNSALQRHHGEDHV